MDLNILRGGLKRPSYRTYWTKMGSHRRLISSPNKAMRKLHKRLIAYLRGPDAQALHLLWLRFATAEPGRGWVENARRVRYCRYFYQTDISSAFESITTEHLVAALTSTVADIGDSGGTLQFQSDANVAEFLDRWCMNDPQEGSTGLRRGPNSSPLLCDILFAKLFDMPMEQVINHYCYPRLPDGTSDRHPDHRLHRSVEYVRYVDDITLASNERCPEVWRVLHWLIPHCGFRVNHKKTKVLDIERHPVVVTGVGIGPGGALYVPRESVERAHALMHRVVMGMPVTPDTYMVIRGLMEMFTLVTRENRTPYNQIEAKLAWLYEIYQLVQLIRRQGRRREVEPEALERIHRDYERIHACAEGNATERNVLDKLFTEFEKRRLSFRQSCRQARKP